MITNDSGKRSKVGDQKKQTSGEVVGYKMGVKRKRPAGKPFNNDTIYKDVGFDNEHYIPMIDYLNLPKLTRAFSTPSMVTSPDVSANVGSYFEARIFTGSTLVTDENAIDDEDGDDNAIETIYPPPTEFKNHIRTYSDNDRDRFNYETGKRHDIEMSENVARIGTATMENSIGNAPFLPYSLVKKDHYLKFEGLEDEYIPNFSFKDSLKFYVDDMNFDSDGNSITRSKTDKESPQKYGLHSEVKPIQIKDETKDKPSLEKTGSLIFDESIFKVARSPERQGDKIYLSSIPTNFSSMSFTERYKLLNEILPDSLRQDSKYKNHLTKLIRASSSISLNQGRSATNSSINTSSSSPAFEYLYGGSNNNSRRNSVMIESNINEKGSIVMGYKLGNIIGSGAWGVIRSVESVRSPSLREANGTDTAMAMKIIKTSNSKAIRDRFLQEIEIWRLLRHENILPLVDFTQTSNHIFALTHRIKGGTLFDLVRFWGKLKDYCHTDVSSDNNNSFTSLNSIRHNKNKPIVSLQDRLRRSKSYALDIINGLKYMHDLKIVHGDIKLENCLIDINEDIDGNNKFKKILLCDFGMSRFCEDDPNSSNGVSSSSSEAASLSSSTHSSSLALPTSITTASRKIKPSNQIRKLLMDPNHNLGPSPTSITFHSTPFTASDTQPELTQLTTRQLQPQPQQPLDSRRSSVSNSPLSFNTHSNFIIPPPTNNIQTSFNSHIQRFQSSGSRQPKSQTSNTQLSKSWALSNPITTTTTTEAVQDTAADSSIPSPDEHIGSLPYSPPEILLPNPPDLNEKTDIWSFGVLIYSLIWGKLPFLHNFEPRLRLNIINGTYDLDDLDRLIQIYQDDNVDDEADECGTAILQELGMFKNIITGCLEKDVDKRFTCVDILGILNA